MRFDEALKWVFLSGDVKKYKAECWSFVSFS